ncbi:HPP family protein [Streptomyces sp. NPDC056480]|uniref:HPP family protein n=1 Tax=Streptomyces sp. NPDC056480 TaxID=3345833 RepID=UPI0036CFF5F0
MAAGPLGRGALDDHDVFGRTRVLGEHQLVSEWTHSAHFTPKPRLRPRSRTRWLECRHLAAHASAWAAALAAGVTFALTTLARIPHSPACATAVVIVLQEPAPGRFVPLLSGPRSCSY